MNSICFNTNIQKICFRIKKNKIKNTNHELINISNEEFDIVQSTLNNNIINNNENISIQDNNNEKIILTDGDEITRQLEFISDVSNIPLYKLIENKEFSMYFTILIDKLKQGYVLYDFDDNDLISLKRNRINIILSAIEDGTFFRSLNNIPRLDFIALLIDVLSPTLKITERIKELDDILVDTKFINIIENILDAQNNFLPLEVLNNLLYELFIYFKAFIYGVV